MEPLPAGARKPCGATGAEGPGGPAALRGRGADAGLPQKIAGHPLPGPGLLRVRRLASVAREPLDPAVQDLGGYVGNPALFTIWVNHAVPAALASAESPSTRAK